MRALAFLTALAILPALAAPTLARAQSLGELAAQEKERREKDKDKAKPAQSFGDDDLKRIGGDKKAKPTTQASPGAAAASGAREGGSSGSPSSADRERLEKIWRARAGQKRAAVQKAQARVDELQAKVNNYLSGMNPEPVQNPTMYQQLEAEKAQAIEQLEAAKAQLETATRELADFEEEARKQSIPPGWLRE